MHFAVEREGGKLHLAVARGFRCDVEHDKLNKGAAESGLSDGQSRCRAASYLLQRDAKGYFQYLGRNRGARQKEQRSEVRRPALCDESARAIFDALFAWHVN